MVKRYGQKSIRDGLGGPMGSRAESVKHYKWSKNKYNNKLKALKKQNKIIYSIAKKSSTFREIKKINKVGNESGSDSSLSNCS